jgi:hypothetical protein
MLRQREAPCGLRWALSCLVMPVVRTVNEIHADKSHGAYCKLIEHSALAVPDNLLFHTLPSCSDTGGSKI